MTNKDIDDFDARSGFRWLCMELHNGYIKPELFEESALRLKIPAADIEKVLDNYYRAQHLGRRR